MILTRCRLIGVGGEEGQRKAAAKATALQTSPNAPWTQSRVEAVVIEGKAAARATALQTQKKGAGPKALRPKVKPLQRQALELQFESESDDALRSIRTRTCDVHE